MQHERRWFAPRLPSHPLPGAAQILPPTPGEITVQVAEEYAANGVHIVTSTNASRHRAMLANLPAQVLAELGTLLPFTVHVENRTDLGIVRILVRYVTRHSTSGNLVFLQNPVEFKESKLKPGEAVLVSPVPYFSQRLGTKPTGFLGPAPPLVNQFERETGAVWRQNGVAIHVDSVILEGGRVIGPDLFAVTTEAAERERATREMLEMLSSLEESDLESLLEERMGRSLEDACHQDGSADHARLQTAAVAARVHAMRLAKVSSERIAGALRADIRSSPKIARAAGAS